jgi:glycosyltransferase involved in cell wall biosynthesis
MANQTRQLAELLRSSGAVVHLLQNNAPCKPRWIERISVVRAIFRLVPYLVALWRVAPRVHLAHVMANSGWSWHLFAAPAVRILAMRGVPVVVNYRGGQASAFLDRAAGSVKATMARAAALVVPSMFLHAVFARHGMTAEVVPNVVDLSLFRAATKTNPSPTHLVVVRHLELIYDNVTAILAFKRIHASRPDSRLTVAGSGPERRNLEELVRTLGLQHAVRFAGHLDRRGMAELYASATITLNPTTADNMPNSLLESLACGVPVVSTRVGGIPHLVEDGRTALLVPPRDPESMASAVERLLDDSMLYASIREAGLQAVQRFTWESVKPQLESVYARALGRVE